MSGRDLYRNVLRGAGGVGGATGGGPGGVGVGGSPLLKMLNISDNCGSSPTFNNNNNNNKNSNSNSSNHSNTSSYAYNSNNINSNMSPISSLALSLHGATLDIVTPRKRLSLHSNMTDTPPNGTPLTPSTPLSLSLSSLSSSSSPPPPPRLSQSYLQDSLSSDSGTTAPEESIVPVVSPRRLSLSRDKENFPSPYYSPSRSAAPLLPLRPHVSPLQDVQNTVNRNLSYNSPHKKNLQMVSPSKRIFVSPQKPSPPDDFDTNSQDSGYSESGKKVDDDCFSVPISCAPRKLNLDLSPLKSRPSTSQGKSSTTVSTTSLHQSIFTAATSTPVSSSNTNSSEGTRPFRKFSSSLIKEDEDDAMLRDLMEEEALDEGHPSGLSSLLSAPIQPPTPTPAKLDQVSVTPSSSVANRPPIRRCLSMVDTPTSSKVVSVAKPKPVLFKSSVSTFKRPQPPCDSTTPDGKRRRLDDTCERLSPLTSNATTTTQQEKVRLPLTQRQVSAPQPTTTSATITNQGNKPKLMRSHSESHVSIMKALNKSAGHGDLIGDFSKSWLLPTLDGGKHPDLKSISVDTLAEVLKGKFDRQMASCRIIDCRYPYEFEGGHIMHAEIWHHPEMVVEHLKAQKGSPHITSDDSLRSILIFHCEFSAERGPKAQRLLREMDRATNKEHYPALHFPEMYLLEGGYKAFYESYPELCTPNDYVRMLDAKHTEDLKHFRGKSKSWAAENKQAKSRNTLPRPGLKRFGL